MKERLATRIRHKILTGEYRPGAPLVQDTLAAELGVGVVPVREALVHLRAEGLIDDHANRGFKVRALSTGEIDELFRLRLLVEPASAACGARLARADDHIAAREALRAVDAAIAARNFAEVPALNGAFHLALVLPRRQPLAFEILNRLHTLSQQYVSLHLVPRGRIERATREHHELFEAWAAGDEVAVDERTRWHIGETHADLCQFIERGP
ncbi:MAG: GntR family transcriptional regulator [Steroidobacteraceae bacterium]|nr:GntR family transcriptional regulator [Steroidobacteraceae bacterium]